MFDFLPPQMRGQRVVLFELAERRLRAAGRMRRHGGALATGIDAALHALLPNGIATELPGTGVALSHVSSSSSGISITLSRPAMASATSESASRLCPLTSASTYGSAATI